MKHGTYYNSRFLIRAILIFLVVILMFHVSGFMFQVSASEVFFGTHDLVTAANVPFEVGVFLNTQGEQINAIEANIAFPRESLDLQEIRDGDSIVNFWIEKPHLQKEEDKAEGKIFFSGMMPGGYSGDKGRLFSLIFLAKESGSVAITSGNERVLLNDGDGTETKISKAPLALRVDSGAIVQELAKMEDDAPPEDFLPEVAQDANLFDDRYFLVFATQDKNSGIDHYEALEKRELRVFNLEVSKIFTFIPFSKFYGASYEKVESPYELKDQKLESFIYIKAVDKSGNERIAVLQPKNPAKWYSYYESWIIILIGFVVAYVIKKIVSRK